MKLSEAIRLGSMLKPQGFGMLYAMGMTCAMGAAFDAAGCLAEELNVEGWESVVARWPITRALMGGECHLCGRRFHSGELRVTHLNDVHRWTREQIADWVESIEQQQDMRAGDKGESLAGTPDAKGPEPTRTAAGEVRFESEAPAPVRSA